MSLPLGSSLGKHAPGQSLAHPVKSLVLSNCFCLMEQMLMFPNTYWPGGGGKYVMRFCIEAPHIAMRRFCQAPY